MAARDAAVVRAAKRRYWRLAEAQVVVDAWRRSGETLAGFARRYGVHRRRLNRWAAELAPEKGRQEGALFYPVRLVRREEDERRRNAPIEIVTKAGHRVRVPAGFAAADLERVFSVLVGVGEGC